MPPAPPALVRGRAVAYKVDKVVYILGELAQVAHLVDRVAVLAVEAVKVLVNIKAGSRDRGVVAVGFGESVERLEAAARALII